tara:strand:- start:131 stop:256 length:126 start_codon:yes stop_codon:yes gene_type:complete
VKNYRMGENRLAGVYRGTLAMVPRMNIKLSYLGKKDVEVSL